MSALRWALVTLSSVALTASPALAAGRYALLLGNNEGSAGRPRLWYAERDAERVASTLRELGGFHPEDVRVLKGGTRGQALEALRALDEQVRLAQRLGDSALLLLFYSGHADSSGLELGAERLTFDELREALRASAATVKVAIVDACDSGALTQVKGGRALPQLSFPLPDERVRGLALVASTAVGEQAQESRALGASFFTHFIDVALRGAGDADGDALVTLSEAFRYTSAQTVLETTGTSQGPQHPTFQIQISGRGDVVLSDLRRARARLELPAGPQLTYRIRDGRGVLAEVRGRAKPFTLALPPGRYSIERALGPRRETASVFLEDGRQSFASFEDLDARGGSKGGAARVPELHVGPVLGSTVLQGAGLAPGARVDARLPAGPLGLWLGLSGSWLTVHGEELRYHLETYGGTAGISAPLSIGPARVEPGVQLGWAWRRQRFELGEPASGQELAVGPALHVSTPVGPLLIGLRSEAMLHRVRLNDALVLRVTGAGALTLGVGLR